MTFAALFVFGAVGASFAKTAQEYTDAGKVHLDNGEYDAAIADFTLAIQTDPTYERAWYDRGLAYYDTGDYQDAITDESKALELDQQDGDAFFVRGKAYVESGEKEIARSDFLWALARNPDDNDALTAVNQIEDSLGLQHTTPGSHSSRSGSEFILGGFGQWRPA